MVFSDSFLNPLLHRLLVVRSLDCFACGLLGKVKNIPTGFRHPTIMYAGQVGGIRKGNAKRMPNHSKAEKENF